MVTDKTFKRYVHASLIAFLVLLTGVGLAFYLRAQDAKRSIEGARAAGVIVCNQLHTTVENTGKLIDRLDKNSAIQYSRGNVTLAQRQQARDFYDDARAKLRAPDCREISSLISSDPGGDIPHIVPRY